MTNNNTPATNTPDQNNQNDKNNQNTTNTTPSFPPAATAEEKSITWPKIAEITDADFGFKNPRERTNIEKYGTRVLIINDKDEICVVKSDKNNYMQVTGGGIEPSESIYEGLRREAAEETGYTLTDIRPLGYIYERREDKRNTHDWECAVSFVFTARPGENIGTHYMDDEIAEGFHPIWININDFLREQESRDGRIEKYSGNFSNRRDIEMVKYYLNNK
jgi:8-oxo-dGTP pyrophosphatase MutT (NUDIX family)